MQKKIMFVLLFLCTFALSYAEEELASLLEKNQITLIVMRHGQALHNLGNLMSSTLSPGVYLTDKGVCQIKASAEKLSKWQINKVFISPVYRTLQTAQIVGQSLEIPYQKMQVDNRLREQYFGIYEGKTYMEYVRFFPKESDIFIDAVPYGESGLQLYDRTYQLLAELVKSHFQQTILLVTHGFNCVQINKCITGEIGEIPSEAGFKIFNPSKVSEL